MNTNDVIFIPTEAKFALTITADGFSMDDDNFEVSIWGIAGEVKLKKEDCWSDGAGHWFFAFDTAAVGKGQPLLTVTAYVPDEDFPDGLRTEVMKQTLPIYIQ